MTVTNEELKKAQSRYKVNFDRRATARSFKSRDKALVLLPTNTNKLLMQWKGPFEIIDRVTDVDQELRDHRKEKVYHANMIKKNLDQNKALNKENPVERKTDQNEKEEVKGDAAVDQTSAQEGVFCHIGAAIIEEEAETDQQNEKENNHSISEFQKLDVKVDLPNFEQKEFAKDVVSGENLTADENHTLLKLLDNYPDVLSDVPGKTNLAEHQIRTTIPEPIRSHPYSTPFAMKEAIDSEVENMLNMGVIEPADSAYCSPNIIVRKSDGTNRFCVDYRKMNQVTIFDAEPMPNPEDIFTKLAGCKYFSRIDLSKGYWQIPVAEESKKKTTSFATSQGLWQLRKMPFGQATAPSVFSLMMRHLLKGLKGADYFKRGRYFIVHSFI